jgi:hypothetical protein
MIVMSRPLTLETLLKRGACADQRQRFADTFGKSVDVTPELCMSVADQFDWSWAVRCLLSPEARAEHERVCAPARAEYGRVRDSAQAEYERVRDLAWAEYERVRDLAWAEYERVRAEYERVRAEYWRVRDSALAECERVCAREFGRLYANGGAA